MTPLSMEKGRFARIQRRPGSLPWEPLFFSTPGWDYASVGHLAYLV